VSPSTDRGRLARRSPDPRTGHDTDARLAYVAVTTPTSAACHGSAPTSPHLRLPEPCASEDPRRAWRWWPAASQVSGYLFPQSLPVQANKGAANTLAALKSIRAARPDGAPIYVILDNLSAHKGAGIRRWAKKNKVELCFTPTYASWANPIEAHFGPLRQFTVANSNHGNHTGQTRALHALPALAERQRPPSRCSRGPAQGACPHPQREGPPLGRQTTTDRGLTTQPGAARSWQPLPGRGRVRGGG
jgi:hypothetical protein